LEAAHAAVRAAHAESIAKLTADLAAERAARKREVASLIADQVMASAELNAEHSARQREMAALTTECSKSTRQLTELLSTERAARQQTVAVSREREAALSAQLQAERRSKDSAVNRLTAALAQSERRLSAALTQLEQRQSQQIGREIHALHMATAEALAIGSFGGAAAALVNKMSPVPRNAAAAKLEGALRRCREARDLLVCWSLVSPSMR
jgi:hypothetical protein